jgi:GNAT superfamily N-acetyltransferase
MCGDASEFVEPELLRAWLTGRSISRGLPAPVADHGGWRVDVGLPTEKARYVFAVMTPGLKRLGETIRAPQIFLKLCGSADRLRSILPGRWQVQGGSHLMTFDGELGPPRAPPPGYELEVSRDERGVATRVVSRDGEIAASGFAAETPEAFVYDRIVTEPTHQRRGLGLTVMTALGAQRRSAAALHVLVATPAGRGLYAALGWTVRSPYATAVIAPKPSLTRPARSDTPPPALSR